MRAMGPAIRNGRFKYYLFLQLFRINDEDVGGEVAGQAVGEAALA